MWNPFGQMVTSILQSASEMGNRSRHRGKLPRLTSAMADDDTVTTRTLLITYYVTANGSRMPGGQMPGRQDGHGIFSLKGRYLRLGL